MAVPETLATFTLIPQDPPVLLEVIEELIHQEFCEVLLGHEWPVRRISESEFVVSFPSVATLRMCTIGASFTLPVHQLEVLIRPSSVDQGVTATLSEVWLRLFGIPRRRDKLRWSHWLPRLWASAWRWTWPPSLALGRSVCESYALIRLCSRCPLSVSSSTGLAVTC